MNGAFKAALENDHFGFARRRFTLPPWRVRVPTCRCSDDLLPTGKGCNRRRQ